MPANLRTITDMPTLSRYGRVVVSLLLSSIVFWTGRVAGVQQDVLTVADFEGPNVETTEGLALAVIADEQLGGTSTAHLSVIHPGASGSKGAARIGFKLTDDIKTPFVDVWALMGKDGLATDLSAYRGMRFQARAKEGTYLAGVAQFQGQVMLYMAPFDVHPDWTLVDLSFDKFRRSAHTGDPMGAADSPASALKPTRVTSIGFIVSAKLRGQFDLDVDHIQLYR